MSSTRYNALLVRYGFTVPKEYCQLEGRGLFRIASPCRASDFYEPGSYLWLHDMEWYSLQDIAGFKFESYHMAGFVPFACTAGGDYWCWQPAHTDERGTRVLCCHRDSEFATVYAPNFQTALFRQTLDFCRSSTDDMDIDVAAFLHRWSIDLAEVFPASWSAHLLRLGSAPNRHELATEIEKTEIAFEQMDSEVRWMKPTP